MRLTLLAVGRWRAGPQQSLFDDYARRLGGGPLGPLQLKEVELRKPLPPEAQKAREAELLLAARPAGARLIALDETGRSLDSRSFAGLLGRWRDEGVRETALAIGGADGLDAGLRQRADLCLSLGALTWPHMLVRVLLAEQLFRADAILQGHPYHRD